MARRAKKHHFVPRALQRAFCERGETIWFAERDGSGKFPLPEERNISSTFKMRNYYTVLDREQSSDKVEAGFFGPIDDCIGSFIRQVESFIARGKMPVGTGENLHGSRYVVTVLLKRNPDFVKSIDDVSLGREATERTLAGI